MEIGRSKVFLRIPTGACVFACMCVHACVCVYLSLYLSVYLHIYHLLLPNIQNFSNHGSTLRSLEFRPWNPGEIQPDPARTEPKALHCAAVTSFLRKKYKIRWIAVEWIEWNWFWWNEMDRNLCCKNLPSSYRTSYAEVRSVSASGKDRVVLIFGTGNGKASTQRKTLCRKSFKYPMLVDFQLLFFCTEPHGWFWGVSYTSVLLCLCISATVIHHLSVCRTPAVPCSGSLYVSLSGICLSHSVSVPFCFIPCLAPALSFSNWLSLPFSLCPLVSVRMSVSLLVEGESIGQFLVEST